MRKKILLTGAAGFIGSYLANMLYKEHDLVLIDSLKYGGDVENLTKELRSFLVVDDCLSLESLSVLFEDVKIVIHLAGISSLPVNEQDYPESIKNNFLSTINVYELSVINKVDSFFFASTSAIYENNKEEIFNEDSYVNPDLMYSYSKKICEDYFRFRSCKKDFVNTYILRFFNVFGPNQNKKRANPPLTSYLIDCITNEREAVLYNNHADIKRDYIFVDDIYSLVNKLLLNKPVSAKLHTLNVTSGIRYSVLDIINTLEVVFGKKLKHFFKEPENIWNTHPDLLSKLEVTRIAQEVKKKSHGDNSRIKQILGKKFEFINMEEGLRRIKIKEELNANN